MSYNILQSIKVYHITDGTNEAYIKGVVQESSNDSPKNYDTIDLYMCAPSKEMMKLNAVSLADSILSGSTKLRDGARMSIEEQIDTGVRRFLQNVDRAKTIHVEKIEPGARGLNVQFGENGEEQLTALTPGFNLFTNTKNGIASFYDPMPNPEKIKEQQMLLAFLQGPRTVNEAVALSSISSRLPVLFEKNQPIQLEHLKTLTRNINSYYVEYVTRRAEANFHDLTTVKACLLSLADKADEAAHLGNDAMKTVYSERLNNLAGLMSKELKNNVEFAREIVSYKTAGVAYEFFSSDIKANAAIATLALNHGAPFHEVPRQLRHDDAFVARLTELNPSLAIWNDDLSPTLQHEVGSNDVQKYFKAKRLHDLLSTEIRQEQSHEHEQAPKFKI